MIDHDPIAPPPSLADILSGGEDLIGRVDFDTRLVPEAPVEAPVEAPAGTRAPRADEASEAATAPTRRRTRKAAAGPQVRATIRPSVRRAARPVVETPVLAPVAEPVVDEPEELDEPAAAYDEPDEDGPYDEPEPRAFTEPAPPRSPYAGRALPWTLTAPSTVPEEDVAYLGMSVDEVAESARARMRAAEDAHLRHLEAIELEAARRLELLTAQAELDAELIRLHARREAHAIITAARARTGAAGGPSRTERRLADVDGPFARFADTLHDSLDHGLDHRRQR